MDDPRARGEDNALACPVARFIGAEEDVNALLRGAKGLIQDRLQMRRGSAELAQQVKSQ